MNALSNLTEVKASTDSKVSAPTTILLPKGRNLYHASGYKFEYPDKSVNYFFENKVDADYVLEFINNYRRLPGGLVYQNLYKTTRDLTLAVIDLQFNEQAAVNWILSIDSKFKLFVDITPPDLIHEYIVKWMAIFKAILGIDGVLLYTTHMPEIVLFSARTPYLELIEKWEYQDVDNALEKLYGVNIGKLAYEDYLTLRKSILAKATK